MTGRSGLLGALALLFALALSQTASADETIVLGAAVSQTGKFSVSGIYTKEGYDFAVEKINAAGGVKVGDKTYKLEVKYYDDESDSARGDPAGRASGRARTGSNSSSGPTARPSPRPWRR